MKYAFNFINSFSIFLLYLYNFIYINIACFSHLSSYNKCTSIYSKPISIRVHPTPSTMQHFLECTDLFRLENSTCRRQQRGRDRQRERERDATKSIQIKSNSNRATVWPKTAKMAKSKSKLGR